jgi:hypothetical protein
MPSLADTSRVRRPPRAGRHLLTRLRPGDEAGLRVPSDWQVIEADTLGPFYTRIVYLLPDGSQRVWTSRRHRMGLALARPARLVLTLNRTLSPARAIWLPSRLSWWMGIGYLLGCLIFLVAVCLQLGSWLSRAGCYWCYFAAALAFTAANYCGLVSALNARDDLRDHPRGVRSYRWWGFRVDRVGYLISFAFVVASLMFLVRALGQVLMAPHWPWVSVVSTVLTVVGSAVFFVATGVEVREVRVRSVWWEPRNLAWWRAVFSFLGCAGFVLGALAALAASLLPPALGTTGSNVAFLVGAGLFLLGSYLILPELAQT